MSVIFLKKVGSYTSMFLPEHLLSNIFSTFNAHPLCKFWLSLDRNYSLPDGICILHKHDGLPAVQRLF